MREREKFENETNVSIKTGIPLKTKFRHRFKKIFKNQKALF